MNPTHDQPDFRDASRHDVAAIIALLSDDPLGQTREQASSHDVDPAYMKAFDAIERDANNRLIVVEQAGEVVGCMQLTVIPYLTFTGGTRLQIEGVRIKAGHRSQGIGAAMIEWAVAYGRAQHCHMVQLTSNRSREDALRFYQELGFEPSHIGFKRYLT